MFAQCHTLCTSCYPVRCYTAYVITSVDTRVDIGCGYPAVMYGESCLVESVPRAVSRGDSYVLCCLCLSHVCCELFSRYAI
jgi:hypothetical protein